MDSDVSSAALPALGYPIRRSPDQSLFGGSPRLIAAYHVLHRFLVPRYPSYSLNSLTTEQITYHYAVVKEQKISQVEMSRFELPTSALQERRSPS